MAAAAANVFRNRSPRFRNVLDGHNRLRQTKPKGKSIYSLHMRRPTLVLIFATFAIALALRFVDAPLVFTGGAPQISPIDELYQWKRMTYSAAHFPHVLDFDRDRGVGGAFCPWPPLYDWSAGGVARLLGATSRSDVLRRVVWFPPFVFALFVALAFVWLDRRFGRAAAIAAAAALAASPFAITMSSIGSIDHHWLEPILVFVILSAAKDPPRMCEGGPSPSARLRKTVSAKPSSSGTHRGTAASPPACRS
jgi:asparagine N-glycosylation enzyme membrane subunit Stt3